MNYKVGHYYKRIYDDGDWIIFIVKHINHVDENYEYYLDIKIVRSSNSLAGVSRMMRDYPDAVTVELEYAQVVSMML